MRLRILAVAALVFGACSAGHLGEPPDPSVSPGTVSFRLLLPSTRSFCDQQPYCGAPLPYHIGFTTEAGEPLPPFTTTGGCPQDCSNPSPCPLLPVIVCIGPPTGVAVTTVEGSWNGAYVEWSTHSDGTSCFASKYVLPGRYVAWLCVTPGTLTETDAPDGGAPTQTCTASGPQECVHVPFNIPGPSPIEVALPPPPAGG